MREMQKPVVQWGLSVAAAVAVGILGAGVLHVGAQAPASGTGGPGEAITVHGHWTIDVRQPDGTLVTHREFENALQSAGAALIADLLARRVVLSHWYIVLLGGEDQPCLSSNGVLPAPCVLIEPGWVSPPDPTSQSFFGNLVVDPTGLKLSGTATVRRASDIGLVQAWFITCDSPDARVVRPDGANVSACATPPPTGFGVNHFGTFSSADVTIKGLVPNQIVQASVTYTFSAAAHSIE